MGDQTENLTYQRIIIELAAKSELPALYPYREQAEAGGLMAYAPDLLDYFRRAADCVGEILNGAKPSDIPVYLASKFEAVINLKTAKMLGLPISPSLLARADEVIESSTCCYWHNPDIPVTLSNVCFRGKSRTSRFQSVMSASDPKRTSRPIHCSHAQTQFLLPGSTFKSPCTFYPE